MCVLHSQMRTALVTSEANGEFFQSLRPWTLLMAFLRTALKNVTNIIQTHSVERYYGKVVSSERVPGLSPPKFKIRVELDDKSLMKFEFPHIEVQKVTRTDLDKDPEKLYIGDFVDCYYQNGGYKGGGWFRGRIASISEDGSKCDVAYHDESVSWKSD